MLFGTICALWFCPAATRPCDKEPWPQPRHPPRPRGVCPFRYSANAQGSVTSWLSTDHVPVFPTTVCCFVSQFFPAPQKLRHDLTRGVAALGEVPEYSASR